MVRAIVGFFILSLVLNSDVGFAAPYSSIQTEMDVQFQKNRKERKFGLGTMLGGALGQFSIQIEMNLDSFDSAVASFGKGPGYDSYGLSWMHLFEAYELSLYNKFGYARWYNANSSAKPHDSGILQGVLTQQQKSTGLFGVDFLNAAFGIQYAPQDEKYLGFGYFLEMNLLYELSHARLVPTGGVGVSYHF